MDTELTLEILAQPTDETCGPACLQAVYGFFGDELPLDRVVEEVTRLGTGGTLAAYLGAHALTRGYRATIYTYNLELFDPTWFAEAELHLPDRLRQQAEAKSSRRLQAATSAHIEYLEAGGSIRFEELTPDLIRRILSRGLPIMTGLSATYLYGCAREIYDEVGGATYDSIKGFPTGHFVVLHGYDPHTDSVLVADPYLDNPLAEGHNYRVGIVRLLGAIMLGVLSYDGNLLYVEPTDAT
ncbi:MAG: C39 family peptidase [Gemmatimonadota bacterium]|nr:C39 family peptidase [Gemmatimonadota bacterium]MDH3421863.1 C39 family peptidase [Gemmatimonadota bacterium]